MPIKTSWAFTRKRSKFPTVKMQSHDRPGTTIQICRPSKTGGLKGLKNISRHRHFVLSLAAFLSCLAFDPAVHADNIGVNFVGGSFLGGIPQPLGATEVAGYVPQKFWNNGSSFSGTVSLYGDAGAGIAVDYSGCAATWAAGIETWATKITDTGGDTRLMKGYLQSYGTTSGSNVVTISG